MTTTNLNFHRPGTTVHFITLDIQCLVMQVCISIGDHITYEIMYADTERKKVWVDSVELGTPSAKPLIGFK